MHPLLSYLIIEVGVDCPVLAEHHMEGGQHALVCRREEDAARDQVHQVDGDKGLGRTVRALGHHHRQIGVHVFEQDGAVGENAASGMDSLLGLSSADSDQLRAGGQK